MSSAMSDDLYDTIVVGAGLSGLAAAQRILSRNPSAKIAVLEARDRVGGRTLSSPTAESDLGGSYVGPTQDRILRVAAQHGIGTYMVYCKGKVMFRNSLSGRIDAGSVDYPPVGLYGLLDFNYILVKVENLVSQIDVNDPSLMENAEALDNISVKQWIEQQATSEEVRSMFPRVVDSIVFKSCDEISMLYFLWYAKSGDTLKRLMDITNGAQERKLVGGSSMVSLRMAEELGPAVVKLGNPVSCIDQSDGNQVTLICRDGKHYMAKRVIVALAPPLYKSITWTPSLTLDKMALAAKMTMGHIVKTFLYYEKAWWRDLGYSGQVWDVKGPVLYSIDDCKSDGSNACLMGFVVGHDAEVLQQKSKAERQEAIIAQYKDLFKCDQAGKPTGYDDMDWNAEKYSQGGPCATPEIGSFLQLSRGIRGPFDRVHFAGSELATQWAGYMDGAVQSGERAADEVLHELFDNACLRPEVGNEFVGAAKSAQPGVVDRMLAWGFGIYLQYFSRRRNIPV